VTEVALKQLVEVYVEAQWDPLLSTTIKKMYHKAHITPLISHSTKVLIFSGKWTKNVIPASMKSTKNVNGIPI
jgi:hypothetical protein